jgi:hypothetical protein
VAGDLLHLRRSAERAATDHETTDVVWRWDSDPFGTTPPDTDPDGDGTHFEFPARFPGQYCDADPGCVLQMTMSPIRMGVQNGCRSVVIIRADCY